MHSMRDGVAGAQLLCGGAWRAGRGAGAGDSFENRRRSKKEIWKGHIVYSRVSPVLRSMGPVRETAVGLGSAALPRPMDLRVIRRRDLE